MVGFKGQNHPQQTDKRGALDEVDGRGTHPDTFNPLAERFGGFDLDVAAAPCNAKCARFYTRADDGLAQDWNGRVWCNPPYRNLVNWVAKAWHEFNIGRAELIVMLLPANRVEQGWWQEGVEPYRDRPGSPLKVEFLRGRLLFIRPGQTEIGPNERPPFGCCLLIWQKENAS